MGPQGISLAGPLLFSPQLQTLDSEISSFSPSHYRERESITGWTLSSISIRAGRLIPRSNVACRDGPLMYHAFSAKMAASYAVSAWTCTVYPWRLPTSETLTARNGTMEASGRVTGSVTLRYLIFSD